MVVPGHCEWWQEATQRKILEALKALLHLLAGYRQPLMFNGQANTLHHQGTDEYPAIVIHPADIFRHFLVFCLVHFDNVLDDWKIPAHASKLHAEIALG